MGKMEYQVYKVTSSGRKRSWPYAMTLKKAQEVCTHFTRLDLRKGFDVPMYVVKKING